MASAKNPVTVATTGTLRQQSISTFAREHTGDAMLDRIQTHAIDAVKGLQRIPFANGNMFQGLVFNGSFRVTVSHLLGRAWVGFMVTNLDSPVAIYLASAANQADPGRTRMITLQSSASCTADVWVF